jgi:hypothetical protein
LIFFCQADDIFEKSVEHLEIQADGFWTVDPFSFELIVLTLSFFNGIIQK